MEENSSNETSEMDIVGLNNRLARYIDTVRQLELKKGSLKKKLKKVEEIRDSELTEKEKERNFVVAEMKRRLTVEKDELEKAKENCKKEVEENMRLAGMIQRQSKNLKNLRSKHESLAKHRNEEGIRVKETEEENEKGGNEVFGLKNSINKCQDQVESLAIDLKQERQAAKELENELGKTKKDQNEKDRNKTEIRKETTKRKFREEIEKDRLDIQQHFQKCLKEMRHKAVDEFKDDLESIEAIQSKKVKKLENELCSEIGENLKMKENLNDLKKKKADCSQKLTILEGKCSRMEEEIARTEKNIQVQQNENKEELSGKQGKTFNLKSQLQNLKSSHRKLISDKISLDLEITAYMKMMELEEERINGDD